MNAWIVSTAVSIILLKGGDSSEKQSYCKIHDNNNKGPILLTSLEADLYQDIYGDGEGSFYIWQGTPMRWFLFVILIVWVNVVL